MERKQRPLQAIPGKVFGQILSGLREPQPFFSSKEVAKNYLEGKITKRRNDFIEEYRRGLHGSAALTYEPALDREVYKELKKSRYIHEDAHQEVVRGLNSYTRFQVETFIGERLNVGLSKFRYDLRFGNNGIGILHGHKMEEPLLDMIARGRDTRNEVSEDIDHPRQLAEVTQFEKIQDVLGNSDATPGTTIVSFSPPGKEGSAYAHNFYDVFILKEDTAGERYVEARRYASGLSVEESLEKAEALQPGYTKELRPDEKHIDAFLISRPIVLSKDSTYFNQPDALHKDLQADKKAMSYEDFQQKVVQDEIFSAMVGYYIQTLEEDPDNTTMLHRTLNAIMNRADDLAGLTGKSSYQVARREQSRFGVMGPLPLMAQINTYGIQQVRQADTGCGLSGGFGQESRFAGYGSSRMPSNMSPKRSSDVASGEDKYGSRSFECPDCHETNYRPYNELVPACQHCGSTKVAC